MFACLLVAALDGRKKDEFLFDPANAQRMERSEKLRKIARGEYAVKSEDEIRGSGYVVESLEAALWSFLHTDSYEDAILKAVNLGDDADTTAAVCGQIAGAFYGASGIPARWLDKLYMREDITGFALKLLASGWTAQESPPEGEGGGDSAF